MENHKKTFFKTDIRTHLLAGLVQSDHPASIIIVVGIAVILITEYPNKAQALSNQPVSLAYIVLLLHKRMNLLDI